MLPNGQEGERIKFDVLVSKKLRAQKGGFKYTVVSLTNGVARASSRK